MRPLLIVVLAGVMWLPASTGLAATSADAVGLVDPTTGYWYLRDGGGATTGFYYGNPGDAPFMGDWDCDGVDTPGLYRRADGYVYLRNSNTQGVADIRFFFGNPGDVPVAADTDGDGCDTVSLFRPSEATVYVINRLGSGDGGLGAADYSYQVGTGTQAPVAGDFDGDGWDEVGTYDATRASLHYRPAPDRPVVTTVFGNPGDVLVAGDWDGFGDDQLGVFRPIPATFHLGAGDPVPYGNGVLVPVAGRFGDLPGGGTPPPTLPTVGVDSSSPRSVVARLQEMLAAKGFYRGAIDGTYGARTSQAVMAFHKDGELPRSWSWQAGDWALLAGYQGPDLPQRSGEPNRVEVDIGKQVAYIVEGGVVTAIVPISSGNGALFDTGSGLARAVTPRGNFTIQRHIDGLRISYLGVLYKPWYFTGGYALHGSPSVPSYPASHGCIRIPNWEADWMDGHLFVGMPFHVYS